MAIFQRTTTSNLGHSFGEGVRLAAAASRAIAVTVINRRAARKLADMPDHLLSDIGLKRDDVHEALKQDWRCDPTYLLAMKSAENVRGCRSN